MFFVAFSLLFFSNLARTLLFWLSYLQRKQYRLDRVWQSLHTASFWRMLVSPYRLAILILFVAWQIGVRVLQSPYAFDLISWTTLLLFALQTLLALRHAQQGTLETPKPTLKIVLLGIILLFINLALLRLPWLHTPYFWSIDIISPEHALALEFIQPFLVLAVFAVAVLPNIFLQKRLFKRARAKRQTLSKLQVVGITGSYGKTGTKEYIAHVLSSRWSVLKTPDHVNVDTGVANQVLAELTPDHEWYIVEMGAYRIGEIKSITDIVLPTYGVLTALSNQHLELFGSREKLRQAKFELVDAVRDPSRLFMNADSLDLRAACAQKGIQPVWYGLDAAAKFQPSHIVFAENGTTFNIGGQTFSTPLFGTPALIHTLAAITFAQSVGLNMPEIAGAIKTLPVLAHTMQLHTAKNGSLIIDVSYNANTDGVIQAIQDLRHTKRSKKIIVFKEVLELGPESGADHEKIALTLAESRASICLLPSPVQQEMLARLHTLGVPPQLLISVLQLREMVAQSGPDTVALYLGRDTETLIKSHLV